jgi:hypothetical protein
VPGSAKARLVVPDDFDAPLEDFREEENALKPVHHTILDLEGSVRPQNRPEDFGSVRRQVAREQGRARGNSDA